MSSIEMIKGYISEAEDRIRAATERFTNAEEEYMNAKDERTNANHALYYLNIDLQKAEALAAITTSLRRPVGTKYTWTHKTNPETYRVAVQTKHGILQVKSVTNCVAERHGDTCECTPCAEFTSSAPWRKAKPLKQLFFADYPTWSATLPDMLGKIVITSAPITDKELKAHCMEPLTATEDALKLKELEGRFPGGVFVLSTPKTQFEISYKRVNDTLDQIYYAKIDMSFFNFSDFGGSMKTQLMVEWNGLYIDLSHLL